jgi:hypothetical protein
MLFDEVHRFVNCRFRIMSIKDMNDLELKLDQVDPSSTARLNRRQSVLAQIEAALLADRISVLEISEESTGTDPYNSCRAAGGPWVRQAR